jgi:hypothetical protein
MEKTNIRLRSESARHRPLSGDKDDESDHVDPGSRASGHGSLFARHQQKSQINFNFILSPYISVFQPFYARGIQNVKK